MIEPADNQIYHISNLEFSHQNSDFSAHAHSSPTPNAERALSRPSNVSSTFLQAVRWAYARDASAEQIQRAQARLPRLGSAQTVSHAVPRPEKGELPARAVSVFPHRRLQ
jgi:hypothetical protein